MGVLILKQGIEAHLHTCMGVEKTFMQSLSAVLFYSFSGDKKQLLKALFSCTKAIPVDLNLKFISEVNLGFTNRGCLLCAIILKALYGFQEKRAHKLREIQFSLQNVNIMIFKILKMFKNNTIFTKAVC